MCQLSNHFCVINGSSFNHQCNSKPNRPLPPRTPPAAAAQPLAHSPPPPNTRAPPQAFRFLNRSCCANSSLIPLYSSRPHRPAFFSLIRTHISPLGPFSLRNAVSFAVEAQVAILQRRSRGCLRRICLSLHTQTPSDNAQTNPRARHHHCTLRRAVAQPCHHRLGLGMRLLRRHRHRIPVHLPRVP